MSNYPHTVSVSSERGSVSLEGEYGKHLGSVVVNKSNSLLCFPFISFNFSLKTLQINQFYYFFLEIYDICNSSCKSGCTCTCTCEPKCKGKFTCLCFCECVGEKPTGCCICICKKRRSCKCVCISICQNQGKCCCVSPGTHTCKTCFMKVDIGSLERQSFKIAKSLYSLVSSLSKIKGKCCPCSCCLILNCNKSCCAECQSILGEYNLIISKIGNILILFDQIGTRILELRRFKNILFVNLYGTNPCISCTICNCKDKISYLMEYIDKAVYYYSLFKSRLYKLIKVWFYTISVRQNLKNLIIHYTKNMALNKYTTYYFISAFTSYSITEVKGSIFLYQEPFLYYDILEVLSKGTTNCCCICCFKCKNNISADPVLPYNKLMDSQFYQTPKTFYNNDNHLCLCLIVNYVLTNNIGLYISYLRNINMGILSVICRFYHKYTQSTTYMISVGKMIILMISIIHRVIFWMRLKYLCICPPDCTCLKNGKCSSGCPVCRQPPVKCCECPKKLPATCSSNNTPSETNNDGCKCKCKNKDGTSCCTCNSGKCKDGKCCRCCCNCFCKNVNDPYYPYLVSIILYLSSLIENIWAMDKRSIVSAIHSLSSLLSEFDINSSEKTKTNNRISDDSFKSFFCPVNFCKMSSKLQLILDLFTLSKQVGFSEPVIKSYIEHMSLSNINSILSYIKTTYYNKNDKSGIGSYLKWFLNKYNSIENSKNICSQFKNQCCVLSSNVMLFLCLLISCKIKAKLYLKKCPQIKERLCEFLKSICDCKNDNCCIKEILGSNELCNGQDSKCDELLKKCVELCCENNCCEGKCPCKELKDSCDKLKKLCCNDSQNGLCKILEKMSKCLKEDCGQCNCSCCKIVIESILIMQETFNLNLSNISKNIMISCKYLVEIMDKIKNTKKAEIILKLVKEINERTIFTIKNKVKILKNNVNTYTDQKNIANSFSSLTMGYAYEAVYEHQEASNSDYRGLNGIREDYTNSRSGMIPIRNNYKRRRG